jgi:hypothetical protein
LKKVPEWVHTKLRERFKYKVKPSIKKWWVCLISEDLYTDGYLLLPVRPTDEVMREFSKFYMYIFTEQRYISTGSRREDRVLSCSQP